MDPISITVELGALFVGAVGAFATWLHHRHERRRHEQRERHHQEALQSAREATSAAVDLRLPEQRVKK